jgi:nucleotide-binding universal stress UspA family protein
MPMAFDVQSTPSARQAAVPRRILLCYDGSAEAKHALERLGEIASVVPSRVRSSASPTRSTRSLRTPALPIQARSRLIAACSRQRRGTCAASGSRPQRSNRSGHPAVAILDAARDDADLVAVGSRHRGLIKRLLFDSSALRSSSRRSATCWSCAEEV